MAVQSESLLVRVRSASVAPVAIVSLLALSMFAFLLAPLVLDDSYSWVEHTTSEAGGQRVQGAWVARTGFLLFGLAVLWIAHLRSHAWNRPASAMHVIFGSCMAGVAAFSLRSWNETVSYDRTEDMLHSIAATVMGFTFALGVVAARRVQRRVTLLRSLDAVAVLASVALPIAMATFTRYAGVLQRVMFGIAYLWYAREATRELPTGSAAR